jgi:hypothetical protein
MKLPREAEAALEAVLWQIEHAKAPTGDLHGAYWWGRGANDAIAAIRAALPLPALAEPSGAGVREWSVEEVSIKHFADADEYGVHWRVVNGRTGERLRNAVRVARGAHRMDVNEAQRLAASLLLGWLDDLNEGHVHGFTEQDIVEGNERLFA